MIFFSGKNLEYHGCKLKNPEQQDFFLSPGIILMVLVCLMPVASLYFQLFAGFLNHGTLPGFGVSGL